ncbi:MAG: glycosyltransferase family 9 protein, partial [Thermoanaerobaculia bacterium]
NEVLVEDPAREHRGSAGRDRLVAEIKKRSFDRALVFPTSFRSLWSSYRAGIPERLGYGGELRSLMLTRIVPERRPHDEHQIWKHLRLVEAAGAAVPARPDSSWEVSDTLRDAGRERLDETGWSGSPFLVAHVASFAHAAKRWPLPRFAGLFDALARARNFDTVLVGSAGEADVNAQVHALAREARILDLSGKSSLPELLGVLRSAALFVGNDSGISHLAAAVGIPTAVVFGPTDPDATRPWDGQRPDGSAARITVIRKRPLCAPCRFAVCPIDHRCMEDIVVSDVLRGIDRVLDEPLPA